MPYDLFISYSRRDNAQGRITQLVERIKQDFATFEGMQGRELHVFFDQDEIRGMSDWRQRILQGLRESRLLLACLSPAYLQSEYCEWEFVEYLKYEIGHLHGFNGVAPIYFVEVPGWESKDFEQQCAAWIAELRKRQHFDLRPWHDQGEEALREDAVQDRMGKLNRQIIQTITRGERAEKSLGSVDAHNPHFIGRTASLRMLRDNFVKPGHIGVVTAVNGVGGLGKTALAIEYAHAFADEYGGGRWQVRCAGKDDLCLALAELATPIGFEFTDDEKKNTNLQFERVRRELKKLADARAPHRCLLLLDNVDRPGLLDPAQVARLNGGDWLHILATTRLGENELHGAHKDRSFLAIDELPPEDALALIESYQSGGHFHSEVEREAAGEICRLLGCFTLAVESAAVFLGQFTNDVTCAAFLARLKKEGLEGLDTAAGQSSEGVLHGEKRLSATLQPTLECLNAPEKLALEFAALLPPDQVPLPWLRALVAKTFPEMECDAEPGYPDPWKNVLRHLLGLRLLQATDAMNEDGQPCVVRMHRLLGELLRKNPAIDQNLRSSEVCAQIKIRCNELEHTWHEHVWEIPPLIAFAQELLDQHDAEAPPVVRSLCQWLTAFDSGRQSERILRACVAQLERMPSDDSLDLSVTLSNLGWALRDLGRHREAEAVLQRALEIDEANRPLDEHALAVKCVQLGECLREQQRLAEAEHFCRRGLELSERALGQKAPLTLRSLKALGLLLFDKGDYRSAEPLFKRAIEAVEEVSGPEHPDITTYLISYAELLKNTNRLMVAEPLYRRALVIDEKNLGVEHPKVATALNDLAILLMRMHRLTEVESLLRRALDIWERCFGSDHPELGTGLNNLAMFLKDTNRLTEAEALLRRALAIDERCFGADSPRTATPLHNLALILMDMNRWSEAEPLERRVISLFERSLGVNHPKFATSLGTLAQLLLATKRLEEAEQLMRRALAIWETGLGPDHPEVADGLNNLAALLLERRHPTEAEPMFRRALAIYEKSLGPEHPRVATALNNLADLLDKTDRLREAEPLMYRALAIDQKCCGAEAPRLAVSLSNLACFYYRAKRLNEAEPLFHRALSIRERALAPDHPATVTTMENLAMLLEASNRLEEAARLRQRAVEAHERRLGADQPDTLRGWNNYSFVLRRQGQVEAAEPIDRKVAASTAKFLGDNNPLTLHRHNNLVITLIMREKLEEARQILAVNWHLNAPPHANTTPRIVFLRHVIALLESQPDTPFLGQFKTLLTGPELPAAGDVAIPWNIAYFIEFLKPKLGEHNAEFLTALVVALNDQTKLSALESFPEWFTQPPVSLDTPWP